MFNYAGKTALITGASSGIGEVFARTLATRQMNVILVARSAEKLSILANDLAKQYGIRATAIPLDLSAPDAAKQLFDQTEKQNLQVDLLVNNAGFGTHGAFEAVSLPRQHDEVLLNVVVVVDLTHLFLQGMVKRGSGAIINVASTAAFQPDPYMAVYGATKAFLLSFSQALWAENRSRGIDVVALCPGATSTAFFDVVGTSDAAVGKFATPQNVVNAGLRALEKGQSFVIEGASNQRTAFLNRLFPRQMIVQIAARMLQPKA